MTAIAAELRSNRSGSDPLGRYYTHGDVSAFLVAQMSLAKPRRILDLGAGGGALSLAALARWQRAALVTVDVDRKAAARLGTVLTHSHPLVKHEHVNADALGARLPALIQARAGQVDAGICNPPFLIPAWRKGFGAILEDAGFSACLPTLRDVDAALLFLAQNLRLVSERGTVGIILPDSMISGERYRGFRASLLARYRVQRVIRLPRSSFARTDALAHILIVEKDAPREECIPLLKLNAERSLSPPIEVTLDQAIERLDYEYHAQRESNGGAPQATSLRSLGAEVKRGNMTSAERFAMPFPVVHTTDIKSEYLGRWCTFNSRASMSADFAYVAAQPGDILIARVGRNLETKIVGVGAGHPVLTDCVLRLRVPTPLAPQALAQLASESGRAWLAAQAYGVSARQLSYGALLAFPVQV